MIDITWDNPLGSHSWVTATWPGQDNFHSGLVMIVAASAKRDLRCVGTGFIVSARDSFAVCITAAHNFWSGVHGVQHPHPRHHPSTPNEFIANFEAIDLSAAHAVYRHAGRIHWCRITAAAWDKRGDFAVFEVETSTPRPSDFRQGEWRFASEQPLKHDVIGIAGYADMASRLDDEICGLASGTLESRLLVRIGRVTEIMEDGIMMRGRQIETTIPVYAGMSGSPVFAWGRYAEGPRVIGFLSSGDDDPTHHLVEAENFDLPGRSIARLLPQTTIGSIDERTTHELRFDHIDAVLGTFRS